MLRMRSLRNFTWLVLLCFSFGPALIAADVDIEKICREGALHARLLRTLEFQSRSQSENTDTDGKMTKSTGSLIYAHKGNQFRMESTATFDRGETQKTMSMISAFDGKLYYLYDPEAQTLAKQDKSPLPSPTYSFNPLMVGFTFLFVDPYQPGMTYTWDVVTREDRWKKAFEKAEFLGTKTENNVDYEVFNVPNHYGQISQVWLAKNAGYYPEKMICFLQGKEFATVKVTKHSKHEIDGHQVVIPLELVTHQNIEGEQHSERLTIDPETVKINPTLPDEQFDLSSLPQKINSSEGERMAESSLVRQGDAAPLFQVVDVSGHEFDLKKSRGKVVLLNFYAEWCGPCLMELPHLQKLWDKYQHNKNFEMLILGREETTAAVTKFRAEKKYTMPMAADPQRAIFDLYANKIIPRTYLIDREGKIVNFLIGFREQELELLEQLLEQELKEPP